MDTPSYNLSPTTPSRPNAQRIEVIKQYYQQLCTNLRAVIQHLQLPDIPPPRRQALMVQRERLERSLQEFSERILKPLASSTSLSLPVPNPAINTGQSPGNAGFPLTPQGVRTAAGTTPNMMTTSSAARMALQTAQRQQQMIQQQQWAFQQRLQTRSLSAGNSPHPVSGQTSLKKPSPNIHVQLVDLRAASCPSSPTKVDIRAADGPKRIQQLIDGITVDVELETRLLMMADQFVDNVLHFACQLAVNRSSSEMTRKDLEFAIYRVHPSFLPLPSPAVLAGQKKIKKQVGTLNSHQNRLTQLKKHLASLNSM